MYRKTTCTVHVQTTYDCVSTVQLDLSIVDHLMHCMVQGRQANSVFIVRLYFYKETILGHASPSSHYREVTSLQGSLFRHV